MPAPRRALPPGPRTCCWPQARRALKNSLVLARMIRWALTERSTDAKAAAAALRVSRRARFAAGLPGLASTAARQRRTVTSVVSAQSNWSLKSSALGTLGALATILCARSGEPAREQL